MKKGSPIHFGSALQTQPSPCSRVSWGSQQQSQHTAIILCSKILGVAGPEPEGDMGCSPGRGSSQAKKSEAK